MTSESRSAAAGAKNFEFCALQQARNYRAALLREFSPFLRGLVAEVGAGIGQFTRELATVPAIDSIAAIEPEAGFFKEFREQNPDCAFFQGTIDALPREFAPDAIVCVNVLEHIERDDLELTKFRNRLAERRGHVCLFVPARPELYAPIDRDFGHFRRYTRPELRTQLSQAGFNIIRLAYFNWAGYFAWGITFRILRKRTFNPSAVRFFDRVIFPCVYAMETRLARPPFGQSLIAVAQANP